MLCKNMTRLFLLLLSVMGFSVEAYAGADEEPVFENMQKRDSVLIGDQIRYGFRTTVEDGSTLEVAELPAVEGVEIISGFSLDTLKARRGRVEIEGSVVLTSFDSGAFVLPPYEVTVHRPDGVPDTLRFNPETLKVTTFPIDTATFVKHDIKGQITYPVTFMEVLPWLGGAVALGLCAWLIVWLANRKRKGVSVYREPAHITALKKLDSYRGKKYWEPSKQKIFYTGVTDAVREYIAARYGISAMEMTTSDIFKDLEKQMQDKVLCSDLKVLFERADFVKFAKYVASEQENATAVPVAVKFVNETYQQEIEDAALGTSGDAGQKSEGEEE